MIPRKSLLFLGSQVLRGCLTCYSVPEYKIYERQLSQSILYRDAMTFFNARTCNAPDLRDKVFVISGKATRFDIACCDDQGLTFGINKGGGSGIGAATVRHLSSLGAKVVFGDVNESTSQALVTSIGTGNVDFRLCDVRNYQDVVNIFRYAFERYGVIDHAVANAGVVEKGSWFDAKLTIETVSEEPDTLVLDINLKGISYFARVASVYMAHGKSRDQDKSLTLLSSAAGFIESRGLYMYQASKHGVLGLLRTARLAFPESMKAIRVNALCPSFVRTG